MSHTTIPRYCIYSLLLILPLYIPLRFIFPVLSPIIPLLLYGFTLIAFSLSFLFKGPCFFKTKLDIFILLFGLYIVAHIFVSTDLSILDFVRRFIIPITLYFSTSSALTNSKQIVLMLHIFLITTLYTSVDYIYQFIYRNILLLGQVPYIKAYYEYISAGGLNADSTSYISNSELGIFRLTGSFGYNHMTSLFIAFGLAISILAIINSDIGYKIFNPLFLKINTFILGLTLILTAARTSIMIFLLVTLFYFRRHLKKLLGISITLIFLFIIVSFIFPKFSLIFSFFFSDSTSRTAKYLLEHSDIKSYVQQIKLIPWSTLFGIGYGEQVQSNDLFFIEILSSLGVLGLVFLIGFIFISWNILKEIKSPFHRFLGNTFLTIYTMLILSTVHSATMMYTQLYPYLFISLGAINASRQLYQSESEL